MAVTSGTPRVRLSPAARREQLLDLGVKLLATRSLEDISIEALSEEAGISRGLLYHYFGNKQDFHRAVVRRAADDLIAVTAPRGDGDPVDLLQASLAAYVDYVMENFEGYVSLIRSAAGASEQIREIYESSRQALTDRIFESAGPERLAAIGVIDTPATRMLAHGWSALVEDVVVNWVRDQSTMTREEMLTVLTNSLAVILMQAPTAQS